MKSLPFYILLLIFISAGATPSRPQNDDAEVAGSRKVVNRVLPSYPAMARSMSLSGSVKMEVVVTPNGSVKSVQILGGNAVFSQAAETAVHGWKWEKSEHETTERVEVRFKP